MYTKTAQDSEFPEWSDEELSDAQPAAPKQPYVFKMPPTSVTEPVIQQTMQDILPSPPKQGPSDMVYVTPTRPLIKEHLASLAAIMELGFDMTNLARAKQVLSFLLSAKQHGSFYSLVAEDMTEEEWSKCVAMAGGTTPDKVLASKSMSRIGQIDQAAAILRGLNDIGFDISNPKKGKVLVGLSKNPQISGLAALTDEQWKAALSEAYGQDIDEGNQSMTEADERAKQEYTQWRAEHPAQEFTPTVDQVEMGMKPNDPGKTYSIGTPGPHTPLPPEKILAPKGPVVPDVPKTPKEVKLNMPDMAPPEGLTPEEQLKWLNDTTKRYQEFIKNRKKLERNRGYLRQELVDAYDNLIQTKIPQGARVLPIGTSTGIQVRDPINKSMTDIKTGQFVFNMGMHANGLPKSETEGMVIGSSGNSILVALLNGEKEIWYTIDPIKKTPVVEISRDGPVQIPDELQPYRKKISQFLAMTFMGQVGGPDMLSHPIQDSHGQQVSQGDMVVPANPNSSTNNQPGVVQQTTEEGVVYRNDAGELKLKAPTEEFEVVKPDEPNAMGINLNMGTSGL